MTDAEARRRLAAVYDECAPRVYAYALRHAGPDDADDVVAETFAVAWRRIADVPAPPLPWLIVTARNVLASRRRVERKHVELARLYAEHTELAGPGADETVVQRQLLLQALDSLSEREREALLLTAWDGLGNADAAAVARCTQRAFRARLMRARARLSAALLLPTDPEPEPDPEPVSASDVRNRP